MATYEIIIKGEDGGTTARSNQKTVAPSATTPSESKPKAENGKSVITGLAAYHYAKSFINQVVSTQIGLISIRTGQAEAQQRRQFAYQVAQSSFNALESIAIGAMMGGAPGAVVGVAVSAVNTLTSITEKTLQIKASQEVENTGIILANVRAATNGSRGTNE